MVAWPAGGGWRVTGPGASASCRGRSSSAITWPVVAARELDFTLQTIGVATANGSLGATPERSAAFAALVAETQLVALLTFDWAWAAPLALRRRAWLALAPALVAACGVAVWQQLVDPAFLSRDPWIRLAPRRRDAVRRQRHGRARRALGRVPGRTASGPRAKPLLLWRRGWAAIALA